MKRVDYNTVKWEDIVYYDETSPTFLRWKVERRVGKGGCTVKMATGDVAGTVALLRYSSIRLFGNAYMNHRIIWVLFHGWVDPEIQIDHIDGNVDNNKIDNLRLVSHSANNRNSAIRCNNTTGITGVALHNDRGSRYYYTAQWYTIDGKLKKKYFSISNLGETEAFRLACEYRKKMIEELNSLGAGYSERHGT